MEKKLDKIFNTVFEKVKKEVVTLNKGDLIIPNELLLDVNKIGNLGILYLSSYYMNNKSISKTDKEFYNYSSQQISRIKKKLIKLGYINKKVYSIEELKEKTIQLSHKGKKCEWCGKECYILQQHHYPIPARDGGTKTVSICPNCHYTFHLLEGE